jgi:hypothetical protein
MTIKTIQILIVTKKGKNLFRFVLIYALFLEKIVVLFSVKLATFVNQIFQLILYFFSQLFY